MNWRLNAYISCLQVVQQWYSDQYYPMCDDLPVAFSLCDNDVGRFLVGEIAGRMVASAVANPIANGIFNGPYAYVAMYCRYAILAGITRQHSQNHSGWELWQHFGLCTIIVAFHFRNKGYYGRVLNVLLEPFLQNKELIFSGDSTPCMVETYIRRGLVRRFRTLSFLGKPLLEVRISNHVRIKDVCT